MYAYALSQNTYNDLEASLIVVEKVLNAPVYHRLLWTLAMEKGIDFSDDDLYLSVPVTVDLHASVDGFYIRAVLAQPQIWPHLPFQTVNACSVQDLLRLVASHIHHQYLSSISDGMDRLGLHEESREPSIFGNDSTDSEHDVHGLSVTQTVPNTGVPHVQTTSNHLGTQSVHEQHYYPQTTLSSVPYHSSVSPRVDCCCDTESLSSAASDLVSDFTPSEHAVHQQYPTHPTNPLNPQYIPVPLSPSRTTTPPQNPATEPPSSASTIVQRRHQASTDVGVACSSSISISRLSQTIQNEFRPTVIPSTAIDVAMIDIKPEEPRDTQQPPQNSNRETNTGASPVSFDTPVQVLARVNFIHRDIGHWAPSLNQIHSTSSDDTQPKTTVCVDLDSERFGICYNGQTPLITMSPTQFGSLVLRASRQNAATTLGDQPSTHVPG